MTSDRVKHVWEPKNNIVKGLQKNILCIEQSISNNIWMECYYLFFPDGKMDPCLRRDDGVGAATVRVEQQPHERKIRADLSGSSRGTTGGGPASLLIHGKENTCTG